MLLLGIYIDVKEAVATGPGAHAVSETYSIEKAMDDESLSNTSGSSKKNSERKYKPSFQDTAVLIIKSKEAQQSIQSQCAC